MKKFYTDMVRVRKLDEKIIQSLFEGKLMAFFHSCQGHEACGVGLCAALREDDYLYYNHRGHGIDKCLPRGMSAKEIIAEHYGRATGGGNGFAGFHFADMRLGIPGMDGMVGGNLTVATGTGIACQLRGTGQVVASCLGDGGTGRGTFHESMLMAATWKLPVVWFCENNLYQVGTPLKVSHPKEDLADFAYGYGIPSAIVDGQDVVAVYEAAQQAVERARAGEGPTFLELKTYRFRSHSEGSPDKCMYVEGGLRSQQEIEAWKKRDPIKMFRDRLFEEGILTEAEIDDIDHEAAEEMEEATRFASESPYPDPKNLSKALYAD
jgi:TPP-dependent pyruvate/acetoin dehydrogenase alpha subunit